ncbi:hypothetical protein GJ496_000800 [Pomphorhynchus laevis]|nr:hypothetical protein GJ496_000800 [Pomphorhynchus laevis]
MYNRLKAPLPIISKNRHPVSNLLQQTYPLLEERKTSSNGLESKIITEINKYQKLQQNLFNECQMFWLGNSSMFKEKLNIFVSGCTPEQRLSRIEQFYHIFSLENTDRITSKRSLSAVLDCTDNNNKKSKSIKMDMDMDTYTEWILDERITQKQTNNPAEF